jgi:cold shock CspA family protein
MLKLFKKKTIVYHISSMEVVDTPVTQSEETYIGQVKWFNNKSGYGFITIRTPGEKVGTDIFAHYSNISVVSSQYKYLVQGEYVELSLVKSENTNHEFQAINIKGLFGGEMMCEVRRNYKPDFDPKKKAPRNSQSNQEVSASAEA